MLEGTTRTKEKEEAAFPAEYSLDGGDKRALFGPGVAEPPGLLAPAGVREPLLEGRHRHRDGDTAAVERGEGERSRGGGRSGGEGGGRGRRRRPQEPQPQEQKEGKSLWKRLNPWRSS